MHRNIGTFVKHTGFLHRNVTVALNSDSGGSSLLVGSIVNNLRMNSLLLYFGSSLFLMSPNLRRQIGKRLWFLRIHDHHLLKLHFVLAVVKESKQF